MRILALSGVSRSGKTTLVNVIESSMGDVHVISERIEEFARYRYQGKHLRDLPPDEGRSFQDALYEHLYARVAESPMSARLVVCDRGFLDLAAREVLYSADARGRSQFVCSCRDMHVQLGVLTVLFCPSSIVPPHNSDMGHRNKQLLFYQTLCALIADWGISVTPVPNTSDIADRLRWLKQFLNNG